MRSKDRGLLSYNIDLKVVLNDHFSENADRCSTRHISVYDETRADDRQHRGVSEAPSGHPWSQRVSRSLNQQFQVGICIAGECSMCVLITGQLKLISLDP